MNNPEKGGWQRKGWLNSRVDFLSVIIACLWGGLTLLVWPHMRPKDEGVTGRYKSMVIADERVLSENDLYRRPDLIALPSDISFTPGSEAESTVMVFSDHFGHRINLLERRAFEYSDTAESETVALAAEAVRDISSADIFAKPAVIKREPPEGGGERNIFVGVSGNIGSDVIPVWSESDQDAVFKGKSSWEVEVSLIISDDRTPEYVFLERSSGQRTIDSEIVRILSRPDVWKNVMPGYGSLLISYSPRL